MKILFVCKHNRFRSKVAESIFNSLNNKRIKSYSAGLKLDKERPYVSENVINIMNKKGYIIKGIPKLIDFNKINDYNLLIITANNVKPKLFKNIFKNKIIVWNISDVSAQYIKGIEQRINKIEKKVKNLIKSMN